MGHKRKRGPDSKPDSPHKKQNLESSGRASESQRSSTHSSPQTLEPKLEKKNGSLTQAPVPSYTPSSLSTSFPPLPSVPVGYLSTAPFQHNSSVTSSRITAAADSSYERLEWLGDAYIQIISSRILYSRFPNLPEGKLAHARQRLVCNNTLARFSRKYGFDQKVKLTQAVKESPAFNKIVADVFEAYTAAVVLGDPEHGFEIAETWLSSLWEPQVSEIERVEKQAVLAVNAKEELRKMIMSPGIKIDYSELRPEKEMKDEGQTLQFYGCYVTGWGYEKKLIGTGTGNSKMVAGNNAASHALEHQATLLEDMAKQKSVFDAKRRQEREAIEQQTTSEPHTLGGENSIASA